MKKRKMLNELSYGFMIGTIVAVIVVIIGIYPAMYYLSAEYVKVHVVKTERVIKDSSSKYLVFTDKEVFEDVDSILYLKFNSSDIYAEIEAGHDYTFKVAGWRIPFLSAYRNIIKVE